MNIMARPIKETPVLYGEDARRMIEEVENPKPFPPERIKRIEEARTYPKEDL
jgi:hypothetical protein